MPTAPNLALLGDIGNPATESGYQSYRDFLLLQASRFERVFVLCGNHEYYSAGEFPVSFIQDRVRAICAMRPNLYYLERNAVVVDNVRVLGCTLWTNVDEDDRGSVSRVMRDYVEICVDDDSAEAILIQGENQKELADYEEKKQIILQKDRELEAITGIATPPEKLFKNLPKPEPFTPTRELQVIDTLRWHLRDVEWIQTELKQAAALGQTVVVLTHHAPLFQDELERDATSAAYATDLTQMFNPSQKDYLPIALWAFGHTHICSDQVLGHTRVVSNPCGYRGAMSRFRHKFVVDLGAPLQSQLSHPEFEHDVDLS